MTTYFDTLESLALAATPGDKEEWGWGNVPQLQAMQRELSPERVLALLAVVRAAKAMRENPDGCPFCDAGKLRKPNDPEKGHDHDCTVACFDAALAELERE
jgi:hypothetical protein